MDIVTANQVAHVNCGNCRMLLMYQYGARSVKCAVCNFVTSVGVSIYIFSTSTSHRKNVKKNISFRVFRVFLMAPLKEIELNS
jgi:LSD1 subclass zinc finger protein